MKTRWLCGTVLMILFSSAVYAQSTKPFPDAPKDHWAYQATMELKRKGILIGYPARTITIPNHFIGSAYEWIDKDVAVAWVRKPDRAVVAAVFIDNSYMECPIGGASVDKIKPHFIARRFKVSPDGRRVLYLIGPRTEGATSWRVGDLNGAGFTGGDLIASSHDLVWLPDSSGWLGFDTNAYNMSVTHYYLDGVTPPRKIPIDDFKPWDFTPTATPRMLGLMEDGIAVIAVWESDQTRPVDLLLVDTNQGHILPGRHKAVLPKGAHVQEICLSHRGDRIAWLLHRDTQQTLRGRSRSVISAEVWISKSDGRDMKRLSDFVPILLQEEQRFGDLAPRRPNWTIDDRVVMYIHGGRIHLVNVK